MNAKVETRNGGADTAKWLLAVALLACGFYSYHHFKQYDLILRVVCLLPVVAVSVFVAFRTEKGVVFWGLLTESVHEARRVIWPTRQETLQTTGIVFAVVALMALILWLLDIIFGKLVALLIG